VRAEDRDDRSLLEIGYADIGKQPDHPSIEQSTAALIEMLDDRAELISPEVAIARYLRNRKMQRVPHPLFEPAKDLEVRTVLLEATPPAEEGTEVGEPRQRAEPRE
jgi:hypothetical protein